ncbi:MAG: AbgT family transporter [Deltaproteobacteria bacterium]|nr:MAG: AbgT family transporter [Deltaproteobacteria bacterium]
MNEPTDRSSRGVLATLLDGVERIGNALPDPVTLFALGAVLVLLLSQVGASLGWEVDKPVAQPATVPVLDSGTQEPIEVLSTQIVAGRPVVVVGEDGTPLRAPIREPVVDEAGELTIERSAQSVKVRSLLDRDGAKWVLDNLVHNFTAFHPLGVVLVAMLGIGVAEKTGLIGAVLKALMKLTPARLLNPSMVGIGVLSSLAADAGYVVLPPVAALLYKAVGRSPLVGIAAVFAGVAAGFSANLVITSLDPLLGGLSTVGAQLLVPSYEVLPTANWYFMIVSTFLLTGVGWFVTSRFVEPRFADKPPDEGGPAPVTEEEQQAAVLTSAEVLGMGWSGVAGLVALLLSMALIFIPWAPLWAEPDELPRWGGAVVPILFFVFLVMGIAFGLVTDTLRTATGARRRDTGVARLMASTMADMGPYIVLAFFAAQFVEFFNHSNLGVMLAIKGGELLSSLPLPPQVLMAAFILVTMLGNLFIGSASAKYAFFAPVFVPMFMAVGISPELVQAAYRVGDSATNIITPLNPYFVVVLVFVQRYVPKAGLGTLVSMMLPYTLFFWLTWTVILLVWMSLGIDLGPGGPVDFDVKLLRGE